MRAAQFLMLVRNEKADDVKYTQAAIRLAHAGPAAQAVCAQPWELNDRKHWCVYQQMEGQLLELAQSFNSEEQNLIRLTLTRRQPKKDEKSRAGAEGAEAKYYLLDNKMRMVLELLTDPRWMTKVWYLVGCILLIDCC